MTTANEEVPPRTVWIEFSDDYKEILATHGTELEAMDGALPEARIAGPYFLEDRAAPPSRAEATETKDRWLRGEALP